MRSTQSLGRNGFPARVRPSMMISFTTLVLLLVFIESVGMWYQRIIAFKQYACRSLIDIFKDLYYLFHTTDIARDVDGIFRFLACDHPHQIHDGILCHDLYVIRWETIFLDHAGFDFGCDVSIACTRAKTALVADSEFIDYVLDVVYAACSLFGFSANFFIDGFACQEYVEVEAGDTDIDVSSADVVNDLFLGL